MEVDRFCDMVPINKKAMRKAWFFISYFASDELKLPPQAVYMVWRREKRIIDDTAPMIVGLVQFERTVRENKLTKISGIYSAGPTKSFEHGFTYFNAVSWKVVSQLHVLGPIYELNLEVPFYHHLCISEQITKDEVEKLLALVKKGKSLMDVYKMEPAKALKWHSFLELAFNEKSEKVVQSTRITRKKKGQT
jgi:hypothetical protein